jgi:hypothetical protein
VLADGFLEELFGGSAPSRILAADFKAFLNLSASG